MNLASIHLPDVWHALGGGPLRGKRGKAFWRDGDGYSVALDPARGRWFDFRDSRGGGTLALVETALGCDRRQALAFLEAHCGLDSRQPLTALERRARDAAPVLAQRLADFGHGLEIAAERHLAILTPFFEEHALDSIEMFAAFHRRAYLTKQAKPHDIAEVWRAMPEQRGAVERIGSADREHAETIAWALVDVLARAQYRNRGHAA